MTLLNSFINGYIKCALWTLTDDEGEPCDWMDANDIDPTTYEQLFNDAKDFWTAHQEYFHTEVIASQAGHDFWLTRNGHGAGFWDGDWSEPAASMLTKASKSYGGHDLHIGDDEKVY